MSTALICNSHSINLSMCPFSDIHCPLLFFYILGMFNSGYHGSDGPLVVSDVIGTSLSEAFIVAGVELGYGAVDVNGQQQQGNFSVFLFSGIA